MPYYASVSKEVAKVQFSSYLLIVINPVLWTPSGLLRQVVHLRRRNAVHTPRKLYSAE